MPAERYTIYVSDERFRFTRDQLESEPDNYFVTYFFGDFQEAASGTKDLILEKDPMIFRLIQAHLRGYKILPVAEGFLPSTNAVTALQNLLADADFFGLERLATLVKEEIKRKEEAFPQVVTTHRNGPERYRLWHHSFIRNVFPSHFVPKVPSGNQVYTNLSGEGLKIFRVSYPLAHYDCSACSAGITEGWNLVMAASNNQQGGSEIHFVIESQ